MLWHRKYAVSGSRAPASSAANGFENFTGERLMAIMAQSRAVELASRPMAEHLRRLGVVDWCI
jgi:hypothetical protein